MGVYVVPFVLLVVFTLTDRVKPGVAEDADSVAKYKYRTWYLVFVLYFIVLGGIRWKIGSDWDEYYEYYQMISRISWSGARSMYAGSLGTGYLFFTYIVSRLGSYTAYLTAVAVCVETMTFTVIYRYAAYPMLAMLGTFSLLFGYAFAVPRVGIALAIIFVAFHYIQEKKLWKFCICVLVAVLFHNTAIFFFPAYFIYHKIMDKETVLVIGIGGLVGGIYASRILNYVKDIAALPVSITVRLNRYLNDTTVDAEVISDQLLSTVSTVISRGFIVALIFLILWKKRRDNRFVNGIINLYLTGVIIYLFSFRISPVFVRIAYYYEDVSQYFICCESIRQLKDAKDRKPLLLVIILFFIFKFVSRLFLGYSNLYIPYQTIWS